MYLIIRKMVDDGKNDTDDESKRSRMVMFPMIMDIIIIIISFLFLYVACLIMSSRLSSPLVTQYLMFMYECLVGVFQSLFLLCYVWEGRESGGDENIGGKLKKN